MNPFQLIKVLFFLFLAFPFFSKAQSKYRIETDYLQDKTVYLKLDKNNQVVDTLNKPKFKKNSEVQVKVKNINPFAVSVESSLQGSTVHKNEQGFNFANLLGGTSAFAGKKLALNIEDFSATNKILGAIGESRSAGTANKLEEFNQLLTDVSAIKESLTADLSNPNLNKESIKGKLLQLANKMEDSKLTSPSENFHSFAANLEMIVLTQKQTLVSNVSALSTGLDTLRTNSRGDGPEVAILRDLKSLLASLDESTSLSLDNLQKIKSLYSLLESSVFERNFDYILDSDQADLELKFSPSTLLGAGSSSVPNSSRKIKLSSSGGFKINTGVAFTLLKTNAQNFYIDGDKMVRSDAFEEFVPGLGTVLNFYPVIGSNFNLGGSFGVSIPLRSEIKGVSFLIGPSLVLGNENRVVISGGLAYSPVNRLNSGVELNKTTNLTSLDNFVNSVYKPGIFFSVSFNILSFN